MSVFKPEIRFGVLHRPGSSDTSKCEKVSCRKETLRLYRISYLPGSSDLWPPLPYRITGGCRQILWRTTMSDWCRWRRSLFSSSPSQPWWVVLLLFHCTPTHLSLSVLPLLVEIWALAERLRDRRPRPWVLHHRPVRPNVHRPITGEFLPDKAEAHQSVWHHQPCVQGQTGSLI